MLDRELDRIEHIRLFVRHGVAVESSRFESLGGGGAEEGLSLGAQVFVDGGIFVWLLLGHLKV